MARSIVLRFDATCFDCGRSLSAGTTARWFGKGRVSCCGGSGLNAPQAQASPVTAKPVTQATPLSSDALADALDAANPSKPFPSQMAPLAPGFGVAHIDAELAQAVRCGLSPNQLNRLAKVAPEQRLCVRLSSGARFVTSAVHAVHLLACITESCRDRIRDVMGAASPTGGSSGGNGS